MKVMYDHQAFTATRYSGVSKSFCELISHLPQQCIPQISILQSYNEHLLNSRLVPNLQPVKLDVNTFVSHCPIKGIGRIYHILNNMHLICGAETINKKYSAQLLHKGDFDIFHPTFFDMYFLDYLQKKPFVLTIHDMMPELFPKYFKSNDMQIVAKRHLVNKASAIIAISENTKQDIIRILGVPNDKITVIYHGGPKIETSTFGSIISREYFLYVGVRKGYKNFKIVLDSFSHFIKEYKSVCLVCTGPPFSNVEKKYIHNLSLENNIIHFEASDEQLKQLYFHAIAFIYPSLYEGFGMPILEAFAYGCPVILNNASCFPEIASEAALYFDSNSNADSLLNKLFESYLFTESSRKELITRGYNRLSYFSWEKSSNQLTNLYDKAIHW